MITILNLLIKGFAKAIYMMLKVLNLQYALIVLAVWLILYFTGVATPDSPAFIICQVLLIIAVVLSILLTIYKMITSSIAPKKPKQAQEGIISTTDHQSVMTAQKPINTVKANKQIKEKPRYFRVTQNPRYIMAEYSDRCILYYQTGDKLRHIRTDFKSDDTQTV